MVNGKKGVSHIEMIISFIFFVGFVFFLFLFLKPYDTTVLSGSVVVALYDSFEEEVHTNLTSLFLKADHTNTAECFYVELPGNIFAYAFTESRVTNLGEDVRDSELVKFLPDANLNIDAGDVYYRVAISPEFDEKEPSGCVAFVNENEEPYVIGSKVERRVVSYGSLEDMENRYSVDYDGLKADLRVPETFEFFIVSEDLPEIEMRNFVPSSVDVVAYDYVLEVLKDDGTIKNARFTLGVW